MTDVTGLFLAVLISDCLTGLLLKPALILTKSLTRDPYNRGFLKKRKSVGNDLKKNFLIPYCNVIGTCRYLHGPIDPRTVPLRALTRVEEEEIHAECKQSPFNILGL